MVSAHTSAAVPVFSQTILPSATHFPPSILLGLILSVLIPAAVLLTAPSSLQFPDDSFWPVLCAV